MSYSSFVPKFLTATLCLALCCGARPAAAADVFEQVIAAWNSHDPDKVVAMYADDVVFEDVTLGAVNHGRDALRKFVKFTFDVSPDIHFVLTKSFLQDGNGYMEWTMTGTDVGLFKTNKHFDVRGVSVVGEASGKLAWNRDYYDLATVMKQVGVLPAPKESAANTH